MEGIKNNLKDKSKVVVYGGNFMAAKVAHSIKSKYKDIEVTMVCESDNGPSSDVVGDQVGNWMTSALTFRGIKVVSGETILGTEVDLNKNRVGMVKLSDGSALKVDMIVNCLGRSPATKFIDQSRPVCKLRTGMDGTVRVDPFQRTMVRDIYAAGDPADTAYWVNGTRSSINREFNSQ